MAASQTERLRAYSLVIPLDATQIASTADAQELRVVARSTDGSITSETVRVVPGENAEVALGFAEHPGPLQVLVGPASATASELLGRQTLSVAVPGRAWGEDGNLSTEPIVLAPYYWWWWREWCRSFVVRGQVVCPDGSPVPAATVCAYDINWWFWWTNTRELGCATTDVNGTFEIQFEWCCGLWPYAWWLDRVWAIDPDLTSRVSAVLEQDPRISLGRIGTQPSLDVFSALLGSAGRAGGTLSPSDVGELEQLRSVLIPKLPPSASLADLGVWPWAPWWPWLDCDVNLIFKVTQDCNAPGTVIVSEGVAQARTDIGTSTHVTLIADEQACCRPVCDPSPCVEGQCIDIADICGSSITNVGGNPGAPAGPVGYLYPGAVGPSTSPPSANGDRAFGGTVNIENANDMVGVDYYEIQYLDGSDWVPLPAGAAEGFYRTWLQPPTPPSTTWPTGNVLFQFTSRPVAGSSPAASVTVVESREYWEASPGLPPSAFWTANWHTVVPIDSTKFADGTYQFRVVGWRDAGGGEVAGPPVVAGATYTPLGGEVLPVCGDPTLTNGWVLTFNNQVNPDPSAILPCGPGSTHLCVTEPNTNIISVTIDGEAVSACGTVSAATTGNLEIEFLVQDLTGNLGEYSLQAVYGDSGSVDLLAAGTLTLVSGDAPGPYYSQALGQGASAPVWTGGTMLLTVPAATAFPIPCCYDLELQAWSRTVVDCDSGYAYYNRSDFTIGVGECPETATN